ncbi:unnamed protein product [Withania somnifera]
MPTNSSDNVVHLNHMVVAMVPFPYFSRLNQLFVRSHFIVSHNIPVHFLCLALWNQDLKLCVQGGLGASNIHFDDLLRPSSPTEEDDAPFLKTCLELSTSAKRLVIIHDSIILRDVHTFLNVKSYIFHTGSAFSKYSGLLLTYGQYAAALVRKEHERKLNSGEIMNTCREVEGKYLDLLPYTNDSKLWCMMLLKSHDFINRTQHEEFLNKKDVNSVIIVSFETTTRSSQEQVNEITLGLEQSNHKFIWVLREADKKMESEKFEEKDGKIELPKGFEERAEGKGMVVRNWVPQMEILGHSSTGGFLRHCGWNSCIVSISMGVPLAAWPIHYDQPFNAIVITNLLKIGISVRSWARREELVKASTIEKVVNTLMGTIEGEEMRQRTVDLSNKIKKSVSHEGPARTEMEFFISIIIK